VCGPVGVCVSESRERERVCVYVCSFVPRMSGSKSRAFLLKKSVPRSQESVLQSVAVCCSALQCIAMFEYVVMCEGRPHGAPNKVCCSLLQCSVS